MAILAGIFGVLGRFVGKLLTAALGWASSLLFGRVARNKQILLVLITFGSIAWVAMVLGVLVPDVGTFLLAFVPAPDYLEPWIRLAMLAAAIVTPLLIGVATLFVQDKASRPTGMDAGVRSRGGPRVPRPRGDRPEGAQPRQAMVRRPCRDRRARGRV